VTAFGGATVRRADRVAADVRLLELVPDGGTRPYALGSHLEIRVDAGGVPDVRSYSLVGAAPVDGAYRIAVKRLPQGRGGSVWMHGLEPGARAEVGEPASHFELRHGRSAYLLIAGGIGVTPLVGMAESLARSGGAVRMLYAARARAAMPFAAELAALLGDRLELYPSDEGRRLDLAAELARLEPDGECYLCGPIRLLDAVRETWSALGRPASLLRFETFASSGHYGAEPFRVHVRDHARTIDVPTNRTLLEALRDARIAVMADCLRGECGLCAVPVVDRSGVLDHRDVFLSAAERAEGDRICTCVSRARGEITIDTGYRRLA
jgi:ferredoxin-NADP reductase